MPQPDCDTMFPCILPVLCTSSDLVESIGLPLETVPFPLEIANGLPDQTQPQSEAQALTGSVFIQSGCLALLHTCTAVASLASARSMLQTGQPEPLCWLLGDACCMHAVASPVPEVPPGS